MTCLHPNCKPATGYRYGCRCGRCKAAHRTEWHKHRERIALRPPKFYLPGETGCLDAACWCEARVIAVPADLVRAGRTRSCGRPDCSEAVAS